MLTNTDRPSPKHTNISAPDENCERHKPTLNSDLELQTPPSSSSSESPPAERCHRPRALAARPDAQGIETECYSLLDTGAKLDSRPGPEAAG